MINVHIGERFGRLQVLERAPDEYSASGKARYTAWRCACDCGRTETVRTAYLQPGGSVQITQCSHCREQESRNKGVPVGSKFGQLIVRARADDTASGSGKSKYVNWLCLCDCGRQEVLRAKAIQNGQRTSCTQCMSQRKCVVCGKGFESMQYRVTCSDACELLHQRAQDLESYYRRMQANPDHNKDIKAERLARAAEDPEYAQHLKDLQRAQDLRKREAINADPERLERVNAVARELYNRNAPKILGQRRERAAKAALNDLFGTAEELNKRSNKQ